MALSMTDAERNNLADELASRISYLSLHTATPGTTGASEATGGSPAYARKSVTFNSAGAAGPLGSGTQPATVGVAWSSQVTFDVAAGTYTHWGTWTASTAGTYRVGNTLSSTQSPASQTTIQHSIGVGPVSGA
jgi:hypothetical protein